MHKSPNVSSKIPTFALIAIETLTLKQKKQDMEKKDLRIVFMGTPEFAVGSLQRLVASWPTWFGASCIGCKGVCSCSWPACIAASKDEGP